MSMLGVRSLFASEIFSHPTGHSAAFINGLKVMRSHMGILGAFEKSIGFPYMNNKTSMKITVSSTIISLFID